MSISAEAIHGIAGVLGSVGAMILTYPLLTITTRQQVEKDKTTVVQIIKEIIQKGDWKQLYSGLNTSLVAVATSMGIYFYSFEKLKKVILENAARTDLTTIESLFIGYVAGVINTTITTPIWVITTRQQAKRESLFTIAKKIWNESKFQGFFKGWYASVILCINPAIQWMVYEQLSQLVVKFQKSKLSGIQVFILGAISKIVATLITYPYIVIKSRMQASIDEKNNSANSDEIKYKYKSTTHALTEITKKEGIAGLYKGLNSKIVQSVLNSAFMFYFKEQTVSITISILLYLVTLRSKRKTK